MNTERDKLSLRIEEVRELRHLTWKAVQEDTMDPMAMVEVETEHEMLRAMEDARSAAKQLVRRATEAVQELGDICVDGWQTGFLVRGNDWATLLNEVGKADALGKALGALRKFRQAQEAEADDLGSVPPGVGV